MKKKENIQAHEPSDQEFNQMMKAVLRMVWSNCQGWYVMNQAELLFNAARLLSAMCRVHPDTFKEILEKVNEGYPDAFNIYANSGVRPF